MYKDGLLGFIDSMKQTNVKSKITKKEFLKTLNAKPKPYVFMCGSELHNKINKQLKEFLKEDK